MLGVQAVVAAIGGLVAGALLNQVIERVPRRQSVLRPGPRCAECEEPIRLRDLMPVVGWLRRRACRSCGTPVSVRQPLVELGTAAVFAAVAARFGGEAALLAYLVFGAVLVAVAVIDLRHYIVPNRIVTWSLAAGLVLLAGAAAVDGDWGRFGQAVIGGAGGFVFLLVVHMIQPRGMGMGDVKLTAVLGLHLGWLGYDHVALGIFLGFLYGSVVGLVLIASRQRARRDPVPFAPFLAAGALTAALVGRDLLDWYLG